MIAERESWHQVLETLTQNHKARERLAQRVGVAPVTIQRWIKRQSSPRPQQIRRLVNALPEHAFVLRNLFNQEFPTFALKEDRSMQVSDQLAQAFTALTITPRHLHFWYVGPMILQAILAQFDPFERGMLVKLIQCVRPAPGKMVRSVRLTLMAGNASLNQSITPTQLYLAGAESLAEQVVSSCRTVLVEDVGVGNERILYPVTAGVQSTVIVPLLFGGKIAGCLAVCSPTPRALKCGLASIDVSLHLLMATERVNTLLHCYIGHLNALLRSCVNCTKGGLLGYEAAATPQRDRFCDVKRFTCAIEQEPYTREYTFARFHYLKDILYNT